MKSVEMVIVTIIGLMLLPDFCFRIGRPALLFSLYVLMGVLLGGIIDESSRELLHGVGSFGFILLLFLVGLEIDLPKWKETRLALGRALGWMILQIPVIFLIGGFLSLSFAPVLLSAIALTSCSVGMAFSAWKNFSFQSIQGQRALLLWMIALEVLGIFGMALGECYLKEGIGFNLLYKIIGLGLSLFLIVQFSNHLAGGLKIILRWFAHWKTHLTILLIFAVGAIAVKILHESPSGAETIPWLLLSGLWISFLSAILRPKQSTSPEGLVSH